MINLEWNLIKEIIIDIYSYFLAMRRRIKGILMSGRQFSLDSRLDLFHGIEGPVANKSNASMAGNLPALEDTNEYEDKSSSPSGI